MDGYAGLIVLELSHEQQKRIADASGARLRTLGYSPAEASGVALLVAAVAAGHLSPASRHLVSFDLTSTQSETLHAVLGGTPPSRWLVDADHSRVRFSEEWAGLEATPLGHRGLAVPEFAEFPDTERVVVRLPAHSGSRAVFGTGLHATTQLAAELVEEHISPGAEVLDVGTGSGILAIYALRLGAARVRATDTQPAAVDMARRAAVLNGFEDRLEVTVAKATPSEPPQDLVVANILAGILIDLMPALVAALRPGGKLITSGVVTAREADVVAAAADQGCRHLESRHRDGWTASAFQRS